MNALIEAGPWGSNVVFSEKGSPFALPDTPQDDADLYDHYLSDSAWSWRPGVGYRRRAFYKARTTSEVGEHLRAVCSELMILRVWAADRGIDHPAELHELLQAGHAAEHSSLDEATSVGRQLCSALEGLQNSIRKAGYMIPKWHLTREEFEEKNAARLAV